MQALPSLVVANLYRLGLDEITKLELGRCCQKIEGKRHRFLSMCIWHGMAWRAMGRYIKGKSARGEHGELKCKNYKLHTYIHYNYSIEVMRNNY